MKTIFALVISLGASPVVAQEIPRPKMHAGYVAPRMSDGKPQLDGIWTNATTTRLERPIQYGARLTLTPEELAEVEKGTAERVARQNAPTSQETMEKWKEAALQPDNSDECRSGSRGAACGYNSGWTDPGDLVMRVGGEPRTSFITYPPNGRIPPKLPTAPKPMAVMSGEGDVTRGPSTQNDNPETRSLPERCILMNGRSGPVMTPGLYNNTYSIVQTKDAVAIWIEMIHDVRTVRIGGQHRTDGVLTYMGDSIGWWDGDTLVVETTNYRPEQFLHGATEKLKVTERFTRVGPASLHYAFKAEDPSVWAEGWTGEYEFSPATAIYEYACHEGNYGLENILSGARHEEAEAAAKAGTKTSVR